jgi:hypothetical protein
MPAGPSVANCENDSALGPVRGHWRWHGDGPAGSFVASVSCACVMPGALVETARLVIRMDAQRLLLQIVSHRKEQR